MTNRYQPDPKTLNQIDRAFVYHAPHGNQPERYIAIREKAKELALLVAGETPPSREQSLAMTKLEEAVMWANAAIARNETAATPVGVMGSRGFSTVKLLVGLAGLLTALFCGAVARAEDPQFGTCWENGTCIGPRVAAPALAIDLKMGSTQAGFLPGLGYGVQFTTHRIPWGFSVFANERPSAEGMKFAPSAMFDFFRYVHLGVGWQVGGHAYGLLTLGTDLGGAAPPAAAKP
jgi:hypothetical protein